MKDKLLQLAKIALNNKLFYNVNGDLGVQIMGYSSQEWIPNRPSIIIGNESAYPKISVNVTLSNQHDMSTSQRLRMRNSKEFLAIEDEYKLPKEYHDPVKEITIYFEEQPPLHITYETSYTDVPILDCPLNYKRFKFRETKIEKNARVIVKNICCELKYKITSGSISEYITKVDFNELLTLYATNKDQFTLRNDIDKINEKIQKYSK